jgi:hypothetical protein
MREDEYRELTRRRDRLVSMEQGPLMPVMREYVVGQLRTIRERIKDAHRTKYKQDRGETTHREGV